MAEGTVQVTTYYPKELAVKRKAIITLGIIGAICVMQTLAESEVVQTDEVRFATELKIGQRFWFIRTAESYVERGFPGEVLAIDGNWVKVKESISVGPPRSMWINLNHVGALWTATTEIEKSLNFPAVGTATGSSPR